MNHTTKWLITLIIKPAWSIRKESVAESIFKEEIPLSNLAASKDVVSSARELFLFSEIRPVLIVLFAMNYSF